ncbi:MAG TPA: hypothetical protein VIM00_16255 [Candidatus Acidoferrum sp.]
MQSVRGVVACILVITIGVTPIWGGSSAAFGTITAADRARVGGGYVSAGATVFAGDRLLTDDTGSLQLRAGSARVLLTSASTIVLAKDSTPTASLTRGTAVFSTANSQAFLLHVGDMSIRATTDKPTVAQVSVVGPRQLLVRSTKGSLTVAVEDDVREIPEGMSYRIVLDPTESELAAVDASSTSTDSQEPQGVGGRRRRGGTPLKAARNHFVWFAIGAVALISGIALYEALESPDRPNH